MTDALALARTSTSLDPVDLQGAIQTADLLAKSQLVPEAFRGKAPDILLAIMGGRELGFSTIQSLRSFYVIKGRLGMYSDAMIAVCVSKAYCKYFRLVSSDDKAATYETQREGSEPVRFSYTMEQAKLSGLVGSNQNYAKNPAAMLRARCTSALARIVYPDALAGVYSPEEFDEIPQVPVGAGTRATADLQLREQAPAEVISVEGEVIEDVPRVPFGKKEGTPVRDLTAKDLDWYFDAAEKAIADPAKAQYVSQNSAWRDAVHAEMVRRDADPTK